MKKTIFYLISLLALMMSSMGAMAQNSGTIPYAGSTHVYTVTKSPTTGTTLSWTVSGGGVIQGAINGTSATVLWGSTAGTYTVSVTETTPSPSFCSTQRSFTVTLVANPFNLTVTAPSAACAAGSGTVIPNAATSPGNTTIVFTVAATGNTKDSKFDYLLSTTTSAVINSVVVSNSIYSGTSLTGTSLTLPGGVSSFTVTVVVASRFDIQDLVTLKLSNVKDFYGTPENLTTVADNEGTATINAVPKTSSISTD